jgi:hypothetical protein
VSELSPGGTALVFSTFLGGTGGDDGRGISLDAAGSVYVTGLTASTDLATPGAFQTTLHGANDAFMAKIAIQVADVTAPVTTAAVNPQPNAAGFNRTDVTVTLTATDNTGGSGVKSITFSATGAQTIASTSVAGSTATVAVTAEGVTTLSFFATDNAGNTEVQKTLVVRIDKTAPEARVQFDPARRDIVVLGTDNLSGVPAGPISPISVTPARVEHDDNEERAELRTYLIQDAAGNTLRLALTVRRDEDQLRAQVVSLQINGGAVITPARNSLRVESELEKAGQLKELQQEVRVGDGKDRQSAEAHFDARDNQTRIEVKRDDTEQKVTRPGLVLLALATSKGALQVTF